MTIKCCCLNFFSIVSYTRERQQNINMDWLNWSRNLKTKSWLFHHAAVQQFRISNITAAFKDLSLCHALSNETFMFPFPVLPVYFCNLPRAVASIGARGQLPPQTKIGIFVVFCFVNLFSWNQNFRLLIFTTLDFWAVMPVKNFLSWWSI